MVRTKPKDRYIGKEYISKTGRKAIVEEYRPRKGSVVARVVLRFEDGVVIQLMPSALNKYGVTHPDDKPKPTHYVGDRVSSNSFGDGTVVEYLSSKKIKVEFDCGGSVVTSADTIRKGQFAPRGALKVNTQELWLEAAKALHGDRYDYSLVVFTSYDKPVSILCNDCGLQFSVKATNHINKRNIGCPRCAKESAARLLALPVETFIEQAGEAHNWKYTYDLKSYKGVMQPVTVICPIHGKYQVQADTHRKGGGACPECAKITSAQQRFEEAPRRDGYKYLHISGEDAWVLHESCGNRFSVPTVRLKSNVKHLCPVCDIPDTLSLPFSEFLRRAREMWGDAYDYSDWTGFGNKVTFHHKACGNTYSAHAGSHLSGNYGKGVGCPYCATYGFSPGRPAYIYILQSPQGYVKVGITHQEVIGRIRQISKSTRKLEWVFSEVWSASTTGEIARKVEKEIHKYLESGYQKPKEKFDGSGETYVGTVVSDIVILVEKILAGYGDTSRS